MQCAPDYDSPCRNYDQEPEGGWPAGGEPKGDNSNPDCGKDQERDSKDPPASGEKDNNSCWDSKKPKCRTAFFGEGVRLSKYKLILLTEDEIVYDLIQPKSPKFSMTYDRLDNSEHH
eukprot:3233372-Rhodomonas_salina.2